MSTFIAANLVDPSVLQIGPTAWTELRSLVVVPKQADGTALKPVKEMFARWGIPDKALLLGYGVGVVVDSRDKLIELANFVLDLEIVEIDMTDLTSLYYFETIGGVNKNLFHEEAEIVKEFLTASGGIVNTPDRQKFTLRELVNLRREYPEAPVEWLLALRFGSDERRP